MQLLCVQATHMHGYQYISAQVSLRLHTCQNCKRMLMLVSTGITKPCLS